MKRLASIVLGVFVLLSGCTPGTAKSLEISSDGTLLQTGEYTNLADADTQAIVRDVLISDGINASYVGGVMAMVADYNEAMADCEVFSISGGFAAMTGNAVDYGTEEEYGTVSRHWWRTAQKDYWDVLCRSVAFYLLQDRISAENQLSRGVWDIGEESGWLISDWNGIETNPYLSFTDDIIGTYFTLYHPVDIDPESSAEGMYAAINGAWNARGVSFQEGDAKLLTIWKAYEGRIAAAHAGVIVPCVDGYILFEKTNPEYPYQATFFSALAQVKQYMIDSLITAYGSMENLGEVAVLLDNELL